MNETRARRLRRMPAALALTCLVGLVACSDADPAAKGGKTTDPEAAEPLGAPGTPQRVAVQAADLPPGFHLCDYSGEIDTYIEANRKEGRPGAADELQKTWDELKSKGATDGYYGVYGDGDVACNFVIGRPTSEDPMGPGAHADNARGHPTTIFSFVVRYRDEAAAAATYESGLFGQDNLTAPEYTVVKGAPTGLGPNSVVASNKASAPLTNALWQSKGFTVFFGAENLRGSEPEAVLDNIQQRISET